MSALWPTRSLRRPLPSSSSVVRLRTDLMPRKILFESGDTSSRAQQADTQESALSGLCAKWSVCQAAEQDNTRRGCCAERAAKKESCSKAAATTHWDQSALRRPCLGLHRSVVFEVHEEDMCMQAAHSTYGSVRCVRPVVCRPAADAPRMLVSVCMRTFSRHTHLCPQQKVVKVPCCWLADDDALVFVTPMDAAGSRQRV